MRRKQRSRPHTAAALRKHTARPPSPDKASTAQDHAHGRRAAQRVNTAASQRLRIEIAWRLHKSWRATPLVRRAAEHTAAAEGFHTGQLSIAVVGRRAMAALHQRFAGVSGPTDVLSFDLGGDRVAGRLDGEVIVCADVARRRAARRGGTMKAAREELALYVVHGILHLAGYDDHTPHGFARMHAREDELLSALGLGAVFHAGS